MEKLPPSTEISNYPYGYVDETRIRREERMNAILQLKEQEIKELRQKEYIRNGWGYWKAVKIEDEVDIIEVYCFFLIFFPLLLLHDYTSPPTP